MTGYRFHADAESELHEAVRYYENCRHGLGRAFLTAVRHAIEVICANPQIGTALEGPIRRFVLRKFPYSLIYSIEDAEVTFLAVMHQKRRPQYWRSRR